MEIASNNAANGIIAESGSNRKVTENTIIRNIELIVMFLKGIL